MATADGLGRFAILLQRYRTAAGFSQEELAERAGLSRRGISDLERGERRSPHLITVRRLADGLGLDSSARAALLASVHPQAALPTNEAATALTLSSLPIQPTSFIGRQRELEAVQRLLACTRLLTLTGAGGSGKTRLALEAARASSAAYPDGIALALLATVIDPELVATALVRAIGVRELAGQPPRETLITNLGPRRLLLVLDNFEHLLTSAPLISDLLGACPRLAVLATSREPLHLRDEYEFLVPPLELPPAGRDVPTAALLKCASVELFAQRAGQRVLDFRVTSASARIVADICLRLDGLPLAIELAAARANVLSPALLLERLEHRLPLLVGGACDLPTRQRTLRDTIGWSHDLLVGGDQRLFRRLAVFVGGCTLAAAEALCEADEDLDRPVLDGLASLVDKNMMRREDDPEGQPRFRMLETIREYGLERLEAQGELDRTRARHAAYELRLVEQAAETLKGAEQRPCLERLDREHDNLRAALSWTLQHGETEFGLRLGAAVWRYWWYRGHLVEWESWLARLLAERGPNSLARRHVLFGAGRAALWVHGDVATARERFETLRSLATDAGDWECNADALTQLGVIAADADNDRAAARALTLEALTVCRDHGGHRGEASSLENLGLLALGEGDYSTARRLCEEALALRRTLGDTTQTAGVLDSLGRVDVAEGNLASARAHFGESLGLLRTLGNPVGLARTLQGFSRLVIAEGQLERGFRLSGAAANQRDAVGLGGGPNLRPTGFSWLRRLGPEQQFAAARHTLGEALAQAAFAAGRALSLEQAIDEALAQPMGNTNEKFRSVSPTLMTGRNFRD